jgi:hypothetical protein
MKLPEVNVRVEYTKVQGGLDLVSPAMSIEPGKAILAMNYEAGDNGGLRRIDGYERYDGSDSPSDTAYYYCAGTFTEGIVSSGDTITGAISGETGVVVYLTTTAIAIVSMSGDFAEDEEIVDATATTVGTLDGEFEEDAAPTSSLHATIKNLAADNTRAGISRPTGSGAIRGGGVLDGTVYVFRDNAAGTACNLWKATSSGWSQVTFYYEISFDTGTGLIEDGDTITQVTSGATATVERVVLESGAWGADAAGRLIISGISGTFNDTDVLNVDASGQATATSTATAITLLPGGTYETVCYNFYGSTDTYRMYGCDGKNRGFEFDGDVFVPIDTGMTTDTPSHVACHKRHLFFTFKGSLQHSSTGYPYQWSAVTGASEIGMGDDITSLVVLPGEILGVIGERGSYQLSGSSSDDWKLDTISAEAGGDAYTVKNVPTGSLMFGSQGITTISSTEKYGNFAQSSISREVQSLIDDIKDIVIGSSVYRDRNQYRVYGSDGTGICVTTGFQWVGAFQATAYYITAFKYPININCVFCGNNDTVFICDDDGWLYQADKGSSFDGEDIEAYFHLMFNHSKSPTSLKTYLRAVIEGTSNGGTVISFFPDFTYSDPRHPQHIVNNTTFAGKGGRWDVDSWGAFYWDSQVVQTASFPIRGNGQNIAILGYSKSDSDLGHRIDGVVFHYIPRRIQR